MPTLGFREQLDNPVLENLGADKADFGMTFGLSREMLASTKADLEPDGYSCRAEQGRRIEPARCRNGHAKLGQRSAD